jgi:acetyl esterase/lipase
LFFDGNRTNGVAYSDNGQKLDIYTPERDGSGLKPVVVFFYGGSWQWGERTDYPFAGVTLAQEGFVTVIPDYRKYPEVRFPGFVEDGAAAIAWVRANISAYGGDPERIHIMGHSAGAHIASLLAVDERYLAEAGAPDSIDSFIGLAGPYRFTPESGTFLEILGPAERIPQTQTTTFIDGSEPPMLLLHGLDDSTVTDRHTRELAEKVTQAAGCVQTIFYPDVGHAGVMSGFTWVFQDSKPMVRDVVAFLRQMDAGATC